MLTFFLRLYVSFYLDVRSSKRGSIERKHSRNLSVSVPRLTTSVSTRLPTWETADANADQVDQVCIVSLIFTIFYKN